MAAFDPSKLEGSFAAPPPASDAGPPPADRRSAGAADELAPRRLPGSFEDSEPQPAPQTWRHRLGAAVQGLLGPLDVLADPTMYNLRNRALDSLMGRPVMPADVPRPTIAETVREGVRLPAPAPDLINNIIGGVAGAAGPSLINAPVRGVRGLLGAVTRPGARDTFAVLGQPIKNTLAGAAAGATQTWAQESDEPAVRVLAPMVAGTAAGIGLNAVQRPVGMLLGSGRTTDNLAARSLLESAGSDAETAYQRLQQAGSPQDTLDRLRTTAEVAGTPGLYGLEGTLRRAAPSIGDNPFPARDLARQNARDAYVGTLRTGPEDASDVGQFFADEMQRRFENLDAAQRTLGPAPPTLAAAGGTIQTQAMAARQAAETAYRQRLAGIDPANETAIPTRAVRNALNARLEEEYGPDPRLWPQVLRDQNIRMAGGDTGRLPLADLASIRQTLNGLSDSGDNRLAAVSRDVADMITTHIGNVAEQGNGITPAQGAEWTRVNQMWRDRTRRFAEGPIGQVTERTTGNYPEMGPNVAAQTVWGPGPAGGDAALAYIRAHTDPNTGQLAPAAQTALRSRIAYDLGQMTGPGGQVDSTVLARYIAEHRPGIDALRSAAPDVVRDMGNIDAAGRLVTEAQTMQRSGPDAAINAATLFLKKNPQDAIKSAMTSDNSTRALTDLVNQTRSSPTVSAGLRHAYLDQLGADVEGFRTIGEGSTYAQSPAAWERFMRRHDDASRILFPDPGDQAVLRRAREDMQSAFRWRDVAAPPGSNTAQNLSNLQLLDLMVSGGGVPASLQPAQRAAYQALTNTPVIRGMMGDTAGRARARMLAGVLDPQVARDLLAQADPVTLDRALGRLQGINWQGMIPSTLPGINAAGRERDRQP